MEILIIEDDVKISGFIKKGLADAGFSVEHSATGEEGLSLAMTGNYDIAVIDITLPGIDGLSVIRELRKKNNKIPVLVLSAKGSVEDRIKGLETGSDDYLTKPFAFSELYARIQALLRRANCISDSSSLVYEDLIINLVNHTVHRGEREIELQPREYTLLEFLMRNSERIVSRKMIIEHVWNYNFDPETNIVEARICKLREKIDKGFEKSLIHTIRGAGYVIKK